MNKSATAILLSTLLVNPHINAQESIEIEIDSAPVEIEIQAPEPAATQEEPVQQTAEVPPAEEPAAESGGFGTIGVAIGLAVAGALAALAGGGGSGGGASSTPSH